MDTSTPDRPGPSAASPTLAVLQRLQRDYPELDALIARLIAADGIITPPFVAAYQASDIPPMRKSLLVRAATGDPSLGIASLDAGHVASLIAWLDGHHALTTGEGDRELVPKGFAQRLLSGRGSLLAFTQQAFLRPWWAMRHGRPHDVPAYGAIPPERLFPLTEHVAAAPHLGTETLAALRAQDGSRLSSRETEWFFDTGVAALNLRNTLIFLASLIDGDRQGGRVQNEIHTAITSAWNLPRLSLPAVIGFCDVVAALLAGHIATERLDEDPCGLVPLVTDPHARQLITGEAGNDAIAAAAVAAHMDRWQMSGAWADRWTHERSAALVGVFDTGFMLNADRIPTATAGLAWLAPYYAAFDARHWIRHLRTMSQKAEAPAFGAIADKLHGLLDAGLIPPWGMRCRDMGNVLMFLEHVGIEDDEKAAFLALPTVGRLTLGATMPEPTARAPERRRSGKRGDTPPAGQRAGDLPLYAKVMSTAPRAAPGHAYLLLPGYDGDLPTDYPIYTHRVWRTRIVPPAVQFVGDATLPWAADARTDARDCLLAMGFEVIHLGNDRPLRRDPDE